MPVRPSSLVSYSDVIELEPKEEVECIVMPNGHLRPPLDEWEVKHVTNFIYKDGTEYQVENNTNTISV